MFLDFDGVLNNEPFLRHQRNHPASGGQRLFDPENVAALNRLCTELPVSSIVVSSSWRTNRDLDELRLMLSEEGFAAPGLLDAATGHVADDAAGRAMEIAAYVKEMDLEDWFALDDFNLREGSEAQWTDFVPDTPPTLKAEYTSRHAEESWIDSVRYRFAFRMLKGRSPQ